MSLSHAEVIAIKQAFVKALQEGGVAADALRRVREQLGLAPDKAVDTKLGERSLKPLSRQQIREILDQNAEAINGTVGAGTIRTSAELYADDLDEAFRTEFPGAAELGSDDFLPVVSLVRAFLIGSVPGLGATLERLSADPFVLRVGTHFQQPEHHGHPMRATVGSTLF